MDDKVKKLQAAILELSVEAMRSGDAETHFLVSSLSYVMAVYLEGRVREAAKVLSSLFPSEELGTSDVVH